MEIVTGILIALLVIGVVLGIGVLVFIAGFIKNMF